MAATNNNIHTFKDISNFRVSGFGGGDGGFEAGGGRSGVARAGNVGNVGKGGNNDGCIGRVCHIPTLPGDDVAKLILARVVREFDPIVKQRGYNIKSVSEMCCCFDGLDFDESTGKRHNGRKRRKMSNNVWGYNQTTTSGYGKKSHTIHLRLRHASNHGRFHCYEDVAGTMAHELAHCERGPHDAVFYKLMDDILEQHAVLMASGLTSGGNTVPSFSGQGRKLGAARGRGRTLGGGAGGGAEQHSGANSTNDAAALAAHVRRQQQQKQQQGNGPGHKLGGDSMFQQWMSPADAAVAAAEFRRRQQQLRLRGDRCCRPCTIDISDEEDDGSRESNENGKSTDDRVDGKPSASAATAAAARKTIVSIVDDDDDKTISVVENVSMLPSSASKPSEFGRGGFARKRPPSNASRGSDPKNLPDEYHVDAHNAAAKKQKPERADAEPVLRNDGLPESVVSGDASRGESSSASKASGSTAAAECIDLTADDDVNVDRCNAIPGPDKRREPNTKRRAMSNATNASSAGNNFGIWSCRMCTYKNCNPVALACDVCQTERDCFFAA